METITKDNYFKELSKLWLELSQKWKFSYSSWSDVWDATKKQVPDIKYEWCENNDWGLGFVDNYGCFAKVKVTSKKLEVEVTQHLHAMDFSNKAVQKDKLTASEINSACLDAYTHPTTPVNPASASVALCINNASTSEWVAASRPIL